METAEKPRRGRRPKPAAIRRTEWLRVRITPLEEKAVQARADMAGMNVADYTRSRTCGSEPEAIATRVAEATNQRRAEREAPGDFDALVARYSQTMPRRNAEIAARRELQRR